MSQALQKYEPQNITVYDHISDPVAAALALGKAFAQSGLFGAGNDGAGAVFALECIAQRMTPFALARRYDVVKGKLRKTSMACAAEFRQLGGKIRWIDPGDSGKQASAEFEFEEQKMTVSFTIEQAQRQQLVKADSNWVKSPGNMLRARVISNAIGMLAPEIIAGYDDNDDAPEQRPLLPEPTAIPAPATSAAPPAIVISAPVEPPTAVEPAPAPAPVQPTAPPNTSAQAAFTAAIEAKTGLLNVETQSKLLEAIPTEQQADALAWFIARGWLQQEQTLAHLSLKRAQSIIDRPAAFLATIKGK